MKKILLLAILSTFSVNAETYKMIIQDGLYKNAISVNSNAEPVDPYEGWTCGFIHTDPNEGLDQLTNWSSPEYQGRFQWVYNRDNDTQYIQVWTNSGYGHLGFTEHFGGNIEIYQNPTTGFQYKKGELMLAMVGLPYNSHELCFQDLP